MSASSFVSTLSSKSVLLIESLLDIPSIKSTSNSVMPTSLNFESASSSTTSLDFTIGFSLFGSFIVYANTLPKISSTFKGINSMSADFSLRIEVLVNIRPFLTITSSCLGALISLLARCPTRKFSLNLL